jgi:hypothetical protein
MNKKMDQESLRNIEVSEEPSSSPALIQSESTETDESNASDKSVNAQGPVSSKLLSKRDKEKSSSFPGSENANPQQSNGEVPSNSGSAPTAKPSKLQLARSKSVDSDESTSSSTSGISMKKQSTRSLGTTK